MKKSPEFVDNSPRNSRLREYAGRPAQELAKSLHTSFPWLTPNEVTVLGSLGLAGLVAYTARLEKGGKLDAKAGVKLLGLYLALSGTDMIDGSLARYLQSIGVEYSGKKDGALVDSAFDRIQEAFSAWLAMYRAAQQQDKLWLVTATLTAITNPLSSLVRAYAEKEGIVVSESGKNIFEFFGTRAGRFGTGTLHYLPRVKIGDTSLQAVIDGITAAATTKTTISRLQAVKLAEKNPNEDISLDQESRKDAQRRFNLLGGLAIITGTTTAILFYRLLKKTLDK